MVSKSYVDVVEVPLSAGTTGCLWEYGRLGPSTEGRTFLDEGEGVT